MSKPKKGFRRGLETVEAAIMLPLVMLITFGALKYGWLFLKAQQINNVASSLSRMIM
jgi:Flp pilus assembly protein TadG